MQPNFFANITCSIFTTIASNEYMTRQWSCEISRPRIAAPHYTYFCNPSLRCSLRAGLGYAQVLFHPSKDYDRVFGWCQRMETEFTLRFTAVSKAALIHLGANRSSSFTLTAHRRAIKCSLLRVEQLDSRLAQSIYDYVILQPQVHDVAPLRN